MKNFVRLFHTIRHLKLKQLVYRLYYQWRSLPEPQLQSHMQVRACGNCWYSPQWQSTSLLNDKEFCFLNERGVVDSSNAWNDAKKTKLWLYNLHYLDALNAKEADQQVDKLNCLIDRWIDHNPAMEGNGWEPYPLSLRLVNLVKWQMRQHYHGNKLLNSIQQQAAALSLQIEYHILANHLFANAKALVFAGAVLRYGDDFLQQGLHILDQEIPEQFLDDGGHFELSPMYHAALLWDLCDLLNLVKTSELPALKHREVYWEEVIRRGLSWLSHMCHPDGDIAFFNDSTLGIAPRYIDICQYAEILGIEPSLPDNTTLSASHLESSGYISITPSATTRLIVDVGHVGASYQPGHAHADTLSFELSILGQRMFVNSGISQYGVDSKRREQRSTRVHNTVVVDDKNSSDVWGGFRVGQRAKPQGLILQQNHKHIMVNCSHDGYDRLFNPLKHTRQYQVTEQSCLIADSLVGKYKKAEAHYHLHPDVRMEEISPGCFDCSLPSGLSVLVTFSGFIDVRIENTCWYPSFGMEQKNQCLVAAFENQSLNVTINW